MKIEHAYLHQAINLSGKTESHLSNKKYEGIQMSYEPKGLMVSYKGKNYCIPLAAISFVEIAKDEK